MYLLAYALFFSVLPWGSTDHLYIGVAYSIGTDLERAGTASCFLTKKNEAGCLFVGAARFYSLYILSVRQYEPFEFSGSPPETNAEHHRYRDASAFYVLFDSSYRLFRNAM